MATREEIREEVEKHIRACLKVSGIEKDISKSLSKSLMVLEDGLGVVGGGIDLTGEAKASMNQLSLWGVMIKVNGKYESILKDEA